MTVEPFIAEIQIFAGEYAPIGWAICDGQILAIREYQTLFSILETLYGGDGRTTFGLPNLRGRAPVHAGYGGTSNLTPRLLGERGGAPDVSLNAFDMPSHSHTLFASSQGDLSYYGNDSPSGQVTGVTGSANPIYTAQTNDMVGGIDQVMSSGGSKPHNNMQPYLAVSFIIAITGIYPSRR